MSFIENNYYAKDGKITRNMLQGGVSTLGRNLKAIYIFMGFLSPKCKN